MTVVLQTEHLSKEYRLGVIGHGALVKDLQSWWARFRGRPDPNALVCLDPLSRFSSGDRIWALRDVNFRITGGEAVGIIGKNGAGKSTLLKIIARVTSPTKGTVKAKGRIASLLEVGTGFHPELTGRENVHLNGAILGMNLTEINRKFDQIVDFAGVDEFIDTPVKRYSSGMYVRLAFAVAAHLEPEILIVDEVLAVGDAEFQRKCLGKMNELSSNEGRTILFVSHNMTAIRNLCKRTLLIEDGAVRLDGITPAVIDHYVEQQIPQVAVLQGPDLDSKLQKAFSQGRVFFECKEIAFTDVSGEPKTVFLSNEKIILSVTVEIFETLSKLQLNAHLMNKENDCLWRSEFADDPTSIEHDILTPGTYCFKCMIPENSFGERTLYLTLTLKLPNYQIIGARYILPLKIEFVGYSEGIVSFDSKYAYFRPRLKWNCERI
jgi:lipopolysaccharide transport system ATP-binding protein